MQLSEIWIYPVKSLGGIRLKEAKVTKRGLENDRRWLVVDENGVAITQRVYTKMALIDVGLTINGLVICNREEPLDELFVPFEPVTGKAITVKVWDDMMEAVTVSDEADQWLSKQLNKALRLVYMPESTERKVESGPDITNEIVSFADAYPFLVISEASLTELNSRLRGEMSMRRFRPNFVISGATPFEEDQWGDIKIGALHFKGVKLCSRCVLTTINPNTGEKGVEPLKTLAKYRRIDNKVMFGQNLIGFDEGAVREGDDLVVI